MLEEAQQRPCEGAVGARLAPWQGQRVARVFGVAEGQMCRAGRGAGEQCSKSLQAEKKPSSVQPLTFLNDRDAFMYSISYCGCFAVTAAFRSSLLWTDTHRPSLARLIILSVKASEILNALVSGDLSAFLRCGNCHGVGMSALLLCCCCL